MLTLSRCRTRSVFVRPAGLAGIRGALERAQHSVPVYLASERSMNEIVDHDLQRGCLAEGERSPEAGFESFSGATEWPAHRCVVLRRLAALPGA